MIAENRAIAALEEGLRAGLQVMWGPPSRFRASETLIARIRPYQAVAREVLRRAEEFRRQLGESGPVPILALPGIAAPAPNACISCGIAIEDEFRCDLCRLAAWLALGLLPPSARETPS